MSEKSEVFRGDRAPEMSKVESDAGKATAATRPAAPPAAAPPATTEPAMVAQSFNPEPVAEAPPATPTVVAAPQPAAPEPELKLEVDPSQLWHSSEALRQRIAQLHSTSVATAHVLDEQEAEARRIAKQLKSL